MQLIRYRPAAPLDRYIDCFWWSHRAVPLDGCEHMLPSGAAQLLFALHDTPIFCRPSAGGELTAWSGAVVHGPQSRYYIAGPKPKGGIIGVSFRPGGAGAILGVPMTELIDRHVALDALWGARGVDLRHRLLSAADPEAAFRILEASMNARLHRPLLLHPAVAEVLMSPLLASAAPMARLQRASGYSPRHFIALFRAGVGLAPKHYHRIRRFNSTLKSLAAGEAHGLCDLAAAAGYSDQAHLTREFKELAGVTPTQYRSAGTDRPLHHRVGVAQHAARVCR